MMKENKPTEEAKKEEEQVARTVAENWAEQTILDIDEWIESQGIYLRQ